MIHSTTSTLWSRFRKNPLAFGGLVFIGLLTLVSALGPFIRPDGTVNANDQNLSLSRLAPGHTIDVVRIPKVGFIEESIWTAWWNGGRKKGYTDIVVHGAITQSDFTTVLPIDEADSTALSAHFYRLDAQAGAPVAWSVKSELVRSRTFLLGTDKYGRDLLSRLMAGASVSLAVGAVAVFISLLVGLTLGLLAGYYRGWVDALIMWFTNVVWAVPTLLLVMAITFAFGTGFWKVFLAVGLTMWVEVARITRGQVLSAREKEYVEAARAMGFPDRRIIFRHILPNVMSPIIVISAANFASAILIEAGLSFLGLGAQIPVPSWGNMIREHYAYLTTDLAYLALIPGVMIMLLVLSFMMIGNGLRDALDVRR